MQDFRKRWPTLHNSFIHLFYNEMKKKSIYRVFFELFAYRHWVQFSWHQYFGSFHQEQSPVDKEFCKAMFCLLAVLNDLDYEMANCALGHVHGTTVPNKICQLLAKNRL